MKLNTNELAKLGNTIQEILSSLEIEDKCELTIPLDPYSLLKIDEDLYYRQNPTGKDFKPTEEKITITFPKLTITLEKRKPHSEN